MEFREKQINRFLSETRVISKMMTVNVSLNRGDVIEEDEYISAIADEVEERLIDLTSARISILNYLNQQVDKGGGEVYGRMRDEFLKVNIWVRDIECTVLGHPAINETLINPDTEKPIVDAELLSKIQEDLFPPGFKSFTGPQEEEISKMKESVSIPADDDFYDPFHKTAEQSEEDWLKRFKNKELEAQLYITASHIANNNNLYDYDLLKLLDVAVYLKEAYLINDRFVERMNELIDNGAVHDVDKCSLRTAIIVLATNLFGKKFNTFDVDYSTRKKLGVTVEVVGSTLTFKPADMKESIQFILMKMAAVQPLSDTEINVMIEFVRKNKDHEDSEYLHEVLRSVVKLYFSMEFLESAKRLAAGVEKIYSSETKE